MRKISTLLLILTTLILLLAIITIANAQTNQTNVTNTKECMTSCVTQQRETLKQCNSNYTQCIFSCSDQRKACTEQKTNEFNSCKSDCSLISDRKEKNACLKVCSEKYKEIRQCNQRECRDACSDNNKLCKQESKDQYDSCMNLCKPKEPLYDFIIDKQTCVDSGGFYQRLCKGPFFDVVCTPQDYCQCSGNNNYSCPKDYQCIKDHKIVVRGRDSISGWRTLHGQPLGDSGICGKLVE